MWKRRKQGTWLVVGGRGKTQTQHSRFSLYSRPSQGASRPPRERRVKAAPGLGARRASALAGLLLRVSDVRSGAAPGEAFPPLTHSQPSFLSESSSSQGAVLTVSASRLSLSHLRRRSASLSTSTMGSSRACAPAPQWWAPRTERRALLTRSHPAPPSLHVTAKPRRPAPPFAALSATDARDERRHEMKSTPAAAWTGAGAEPSGARGDPQRGGDDVRHC